MCGDGTPDFLHTPSSLARLVLATGGTDTRVHLYVRPPRGLFQPAIKLTGHENWVRSLAFVHVWAPADAAARTAAEGPRQLLLASASQDR